MNEITFAWDEKKNSININKHGVSFEEAKTVFFDSNARLIPDPEHSSSEERFILMGFSNKLNILLVVHSFNKEKEIRIISVRKATKNERKQYEDYLK